MEQQFIEVYAPLEARTVVVGGAGSIEVAQPHVIEVVEAPARASVVEIITAGGQGIQGNPGPPGPPGSVDITEDLLAWYVLAKI